MTDRPNSDPQQRCAALFDGEECGQPSGGYRHVRCQNLKDNLHRPGLICHDFVSQPSTTEEKS